MTTQADIFEPADYRWRGLTMTPAAAAHICELVAKQPGLLGIRLRVKQSGCAGFGYVLEQVSAPEPGDLLFEQQGARLWVPLKAMPLIDGTEVDYVRDGLNQVFKFHNPNAQNACGCGESFGV
ncbi:Fe-S cluster assembly scaffold SufA [Shimwellia blattae]|uniref:SufA scaffold protein for iron-sulfur cluster assembly n=1 Tax=Shimwellia blattae (strain ATCC 29907 / DSM 4481 / JCM 1650 / NBRC 105725 / CDC 9005-74) TaxID=630626 RepID=I2B8B4_SHIBC|nr:Fe-S cluster assembly scaffold SufA [Shimwellia blattae]AFJ46768.1 SufA scaffold protein for iron-sulfur cluster assembly [Shimwellia blattae DSM 4481 = NBRC 105725]GAB82077.1 iron-sulfur cluster assembly protein SufA [Shimwellia blattae DSM 4481 = NBRC 105725]VDY64246.1 iron-sulfur cluster assembly scaffold protein [Shimwellia blattae]VEC22371.1 iron-sulfur cluster assembly scaffold protein [Shimwellia blattae]